MVGLVAELPRRPGLAVVGRLDGIVEMSGVALDDDGIPHGRLVDDGDAGDEPVLDLDMDGHEILEDDASGRWAGLRHGAAPFVGGTGGAAEAAPPVRSLGRDEVAFVFFAGGLLVFACEEVGQRRAVILPADLYHRIGRLHLGD